MPVSTAKPVKAANSYSHAIYRITKFSVPKQPRNKLHSEVTEGNLGDRQDAAMLTTKG